MGVGGGAGCTAEVLGGRLQGTKTQSVVHKEINFIQQKNARASYIRITQDA